MMSLICSNRPSKRAISCCFAVSKENAIYSFFATLRLSALNLLTVALIIRRMCKNCFKRAVLLSESSFLIFIFICPMGAYVRLSFDACRLSAYLFLVKLIWPRRETQKSPPCRNHQYLPPTWLPVDTTSKI